MKKFIQLTLTIFFLLFTTTGFAQQHYKKPQDLFKNSKNQKGTANANNTLNKKANPNPESTIELEWMGSSFDTTAKTEYWYNAAENPTLRLTSMFYAGTYVAAMHDTLQYNASGQLIQRRVRVFDGSQWVNNYRQLISHNSQGDIEEDLMQTWDTTTSTWQNIYGSKYLYTYDSNNQPSEIINQYLVPPSTTYQNAFKEFYTYGSNNTPEDVEFHIYDDSSATWQRAFRYTNIVWHNWDGNLHNPLVTDAELQYWVGTWIPAERITASYNSDDQMLSELTEIWNGTGYDPSHRFTNTYDPYGNHRTSFEEEYDPFVPGWDTMYGENYDYTYNTNNSINTVVEQDYNHGTWENHTKRLYFYGQISGITIQPALALNIYPNPAKDVLNLNLQAQQFNVTITDLAGRTVLLSQNNKTLDVSNLKPGIYMVNISGEQGNATLKFIKN